MSKKDLYWFKHDSNAKRDIKILELLAEYGAEGYGWFWMLLELMREQTDYKLKLNYRLLSKELYTEPDKIERFIKDCVYEYELFQCDSKYFWSPSFLRRMEAYDNVCEKRRNAVNTRWIG